MPKKYFCKTMEDFEICGETRPESFEPGRFSICRKCRVKRNKLSKDKKFDLVIEERNNKIDPSSDIRYLIEDIILRYPLLHGKTILERFEDDEQETTNLLLSTHSKFELIQQENNILKQKIEYLEKYIKLIEPKIDTK